MYYNATKIKQYDSRTDYIYMNVVNDRCLLACHYLIQNEIVGFYYNNNQ